MGEKKKLEDEVHSLQNMMEDDRKEMAELRRNHQVNIHYFNLSSSFT